MPRLTPPTSYLCRASRKRPTWLCWNSRRKRGRLKMRNSKRGPYLRKIRRVHRLRLRGREWPITHPMIGKKMLVVFSHWRAWRRGKCTFVGTQESCISVSSFLVSNEGSAAIFFLSRTIRKFEATATSSFAHSTIKEPFSKQF